MNPVSINTVARPAVAVMNRLRYAWKFIFIGLALLVPFGYTAYLQYNGSTASVDFSAKERIGVTYITPARDLLRDLQRRRILVVASMTGTPVNDLLASNQSDLDRSLAATDAVDQRFGGVLSTTPKWNEIKSDWGTLSGRQLGSAADADAAYATLTAKVADLILNYAGNNSNLILDPDLDSYWLMDAWTGKMPALGQYISALASRAMIQDASATQDRAVAIGGQYTALVGTSGDLDAIDMATAFKFNNSHEANLEKVLAAPTRDTVKTLTSFADLVRRDYLAPNPNSRALVDRANEALDQSYGLYTQIGPQLDHLIAVRVAGYQGDRSSGLFAALIAAIVLAYLFLGFYVSVRGSVAALASATTRMIQGTAETFRLDAKDEIGAIAIGYNQINVALQEARTLRAKVEEDNRELQGNVVELLQVVSEASDGDLTVRATIGTGALGNVADAFNQLLEALTVLLGDTHRQIEQTTKVVAEIRAASEQMTTGASSQAAELVAATELVEQVTTQIAQVSKIAESAAEAARRAKDSAEAGSESVQNVVTGMQSLRSNVQAGAKKMKNLGERSMEITSIVNTIQRISEQTNMLALNAAIEAARAGEHGRGFTVVADEVRKLAERTANATDEIGKLVKTIHSETSETVEAIEQQTLVVEEEAGMVATAGDSLGQILEVSNESFALVANIRSVAADQVSGTRRVQSTMQQISEIAQRTQLGAQSNLTIIEQLVQQSTQLSTAMRRFRLRAAT